ISVRARVDVDAPSRDGPSGAVRVPINPCERTSGKRGMLSYRIWACRALFCCLGKDFVVQGTRLASDLGFPEGPVVMPDGGIVFCDGNTGELLQWKDEQLSTFAQMGGSPWGALLGTDGAVYVTQGGNVPGSPDQSAIPGIQRVNPDGSIEMLATSIAGHRLAGPNDLAFGPDGKLWFTESGTEQDDRHPDPQPGRLTTLAPDAGREVRRA